MVVHLHNGAINSSNIETGRFIKKSSCSISRSPSIYDSEKKSSSSSSSSSTLSVMSSYLSGKMCPLTPSQKQTDVSHLVLQKELKEKLERKKTGKRERDSANLILKCKYFLFLKMSWSARS